MITEAIITSFLDLLTWLVGLLPTDTVTWPIVSGLSSWVGNQLGPLNSMAPLDEGFTAVELAVDTIIPTLISVRVILWLYFMLPGKMS